MLSALLILVVVSAAPPADDSASVATTRAADPPATSRDLTAIPGDLHSSPSDLIFQDGFENGTSTWSEASTYSFFSSGSTPSIDLSTCNLQPGTYTLRLDADRLVEGALDSGHTLEYTVTVVEERCQDGSGTCLSVSFSDPVESFR